MRMTEAPLPQETVDQAIDWMVRLRFSVPDARTRQGFQRWLDSHPNHALAWQRLDLMSNEFARLPPTLSRNTLTASNARQLSRRDGLKLLTLLSVGVGALWLSKGQLPLPTLLADQRSAVGERRTLTGPQGSRIMLNTDSAVGFDDSAAGGQLTLLQGEMLLEIDAVSAIAGPLQLNTRDGYLHISDARVLLREREHFMALSVQRGSVQVFLGARSNAPAYQVNAGQSLTFNSAELLAAPGNGIDPWGWSEGILSAHKARLGDVIAELSRYRRGVLQCADDVADLSVSGSFQLGDTDQVLTLLAAALPVRVDYRTRFWARVSHA